LGRATKQLLDWNGSLSYGRPGLTNALGYGRPGLTNALGYGHPGLTNATRARCAQVAGLLAMAVLDPMVHPQAAYGSYSLPTTTTAGGGFVLSCTSACVVCPLVTASNNTKQTRCDVLCKRGRCILIQRTRRLLSFIILLRRIKLININ